MITGFYFPPGTLGSELESRDLTIRSMLNPETLQYCFIKPDTPKEILAREKKELDNQYTTRDIFKEFFTEN